jgi:hypothetical protein
MLEERHQDADHSDSTITDVDEAITPESSVEYPDYALKDSVSNSAVEGENQKPFGLGEAHPSCEVEAAMLLLGFKGQR